MRHNHQRCGKAVRTRSQKGTKLTAADISNVIFARPPIVRFSPVPSATTVPYCAKSNGRRSFHHTLTSIFDNIFLIVWTSIDVWFFILANPVTLITVWCVIPVTNIVTIYQIWSAWTLPITGTRFTRH